MIASNIFAEQILIIMSEFGDDDVPSPLVEDYDMGGDNDTEDASHLLFGEDDAEEEGGGRSSASSSMMG